FTCLLPDGERVKVKYGWTREIQAEVAGGRVLGGPRGGPGGARFSPRGGGRVKVKYGGTREIQAEVAASRLLARLGFGSDDMFIVPRVRCYGCPRLPFEFSLLVDRIHADAAV